MKKIDIEKITSWHNNNCQKELDIRHLTLEQMQPYIEGLGSLFKVEKIGKSHQGRDIHKIVFGEGDSRILLWTQMHGNESTTSKAIFDFLKFLRQKKDFQDEIGMFLDTFTIFLIPILNPDGAERYTRENANSMDLNRDARLLSQKESIILNKIFESVRPSLCLNLHGQRTIYGLENGLSASVSFLAPAANKERSLTNSRETAMKHIIRMNNVLQQYIPNQVGRYDDSFNENCVGDSFQMQGVPTILFEAGHYKDDYQREKTRMFIFYAFLELFGITAISENPENSDAYFTIPENKENYKDLVLRNARIGQYKDPVDIAVQYSEILQDRDIKFEAYIDTIGECNSIYGHREVDLEGDSILINSQEKIEVGQKVSTIVKKNESSVTIFPKK